MLSTLSPQIGHIQVTFASVVVAVVVEVAASVSIVSTEN